MINYKLYQDNRSNSHYPGKWYARATHSQTLGLRELSAHMASHNCGFSKGQIQGILTDMVGCIRELILDGKSVKIPDLGIFYPSLKARPAGSVAAFNVKENIASVRVGCRSTGAGRASRRTDVHVAEAPVYTGGTAKQDNEQFPPAP